ncbi:MAG: hypothetical protein BWY59_00675 [Verrucomicrobia bacterium ADurb.Bin345]|nr:MAG: hypothetical protein BWY59_00675 [Verrucomicrobia bacterium ADurb.Bin345]
MMMRRVMGVLFSAILSAALVAQAEEGAGAKWENRINGGLNLTRGNSKNMLLNAGAASERKGDANEVSLGAEINYGETEVKKDGEEYDETNVDNAKAFAKYRRLLDERNYVYLNGDVGRDEMADIRYRAIVGPGVGRYFLKGDKHTLSAELGAGYVFEDVGGVEDDYAAARVAQAYELKLGDGTRFWESVEYLPRVDDMSQYLLNAEIGAEAAMTAKLSLRVVLQNKYNSEPAPDRDSNDLTLTAGVAYKL